MTDQQKQKAGWLAEHVREWQPVREGVYDDGVELHYTSEFRGQSWMPFDRIDHAKQVQRVMVKRGWSLSLHSLDDGRLTEYLVVWQHDELGSGSGRDASEATAICDATGDALGWPFGKEDA